MLFGCGQDVATGRRCDNGERACSAAGSSGAGAGGASGSIGGPGGDGTVVSNDNPLSIHVEDIEGMTIEIVTLACAGDCADIEAVAHGGHPPYAFAWEDGSTDAARRVCLDASAELSVSATDTGFDVDEFEYDAHTISTEVSARVLTCSDGGVPDAGAEDCEPVDDAMPEELTPDIFGVPSYFNEGEALPPGRYRIEYVDGCLKYDANWA